jgi:hypothetical protein
LHEAARDKTSSAMALRRVMVSRVVSASAEEELSVLISVRISQGIISCAPTRPSMVRMVSKMERT